MPALLFSAGSSVVLDTHAGDMFDDPKHRRLAFRWLAPLATPLDSFQYMHGEDTVFANDFVACNDVHDFKPTHVSVLLNSELATPLLLAFTTRRKGKNKQSRAQRKRKDREDKHPSTVPGARAGLAWNDDILRQKGKHVVISCEIPVATEPREEATTSETLKVMLGTIWKFRIDGYYEVVSTTFNACVHSGSHWMPHATRLAQIAIFRDVVPTHVRMIPSHWVHFWNLSRSLTSMYGSIWLPPMWMPTCRSICI